MASSAIWDRTAMAALRLQDAGQLEKGLYLGRHLIGHNTPIDGGIYVGKTIGREGLIVDSKHPRQKALLKHALELAKREKTEEGLLKLAYRLVDEAMPSRDSFLWEEELEKRKFGKDSSVSMDVPLEVRIADCRMLALESGAIVEKFIDEGLLTGKVSVNRNAVRLGQRTLAHAWSRYESAMSGKKYISDISLKFFGELSKQTVWPYERPEDEIDIKKIEPSEENFTQKWRRIWNSLMRKEVSVQQGYALLRKGEFEEAVDVFLNLGMVGIGDEMYRRAANQAQRKGNDLKAAKLWMRGNLPERAKTLYYNLGQIEFNKRKFEEAAELFSKAGSDSMARASYFHAGRKFELEDKYYEAIDCYDKGGHKNEADQLRRFF